MPSAIPKVDVSTTWAPCLRCPHKHPAHAACPPSGVWLVLTLCPMCNATTQLYCRKHRDRHMPLVLTGDHPLGIAAVPDARGLAAGEREDG